jgi:uroporphyrinogen-III synthase
VTEKHEAERAAKPEGAGWLTGRRLLVLRASHQADEAAGAIRERGAAPVLAAAIEICDPPDPSALHAAAREVASYDWVLFTSPNGVKRFVRALEALGQGTDALRSRRIGVIGPGTLQALEGYGLEAELVPAEYTAEALANTLLARARPERVLIPRARVANPALPAILEQAGVAVTVVPAYETRVVGGDDRSRLARAIEQGVDAILLTSGSTVEALAEALGDQARDLPARIVVAAIGPVTHAAAEQYGVRVDLVATDHTIRGLLDALAAHYAATAHAG